MVWNHEALNEQALALLVKLEVQPKDNIFSQDLIEGWSRLLMN